MNAGEIGVAAQSRMLEGEGLDAVQETAVPPNAPTGIVLSTKQLQSQEDA